MKERERKQRVGHDGWSCEVCVWGGHILHQLPLCQTLCCESVCVCVLQMCVCRMYHESEKRWGADRLSVVKQVGGVPGSLSVSLSSTPHFPQSLIHSAPLDDTQGHCNTAKVLDGTWYQEAQG